jgi:phosphoribosylamine--glycine ligase
MPSVLVIGGGGREHALVEALLASPARPEVIAAPGNPGMPGRARAVALGDLSALEAAAEGVDLVVVGPEAPLVAGLADRLRARGIPTLGPSAAAARLEGSKAFSKALMTRVGVPTARWARHTEPAAAKAYVRELSGGAVVKADGLAAGKGVVVAEHPEAADAAIDDMLVRGARGAAGQSVVIEERLVGEELSVLGLSDGERLRLLPAARDHKRLEDGDRGPNTGGMGAFAPAPRATPALIADVRDRCMQPVVDALREAGTPFVGVLYAGIMLTSAGPRVLEYNVRFGDPEAQAILPLLTEDVFSTFSSAARGALEPGFVASRDGAAVTVVLASAGYPRTSAKGQPITGLDALDGRDDLRVYHAGTARGDDGRLVTAGGRVLAVTGLGATLEAARERAYAGADAVVFEGRQLRRDIARLPGGGG